MGRAARWRAASLLLILSAGLPNAFAIDAARYVIVSKEAGTIDVERDHYSVSFLTGWVSDKDNFFKALFSDKKDGLIQITSTNKFFEGDPIVGEHMAVLLDLRSNTNRPIGQAIQVFDQIPGDVGTRIAIKIALHREDTISTVIKSLEDARAGLPSDLFAAPWVGYSKAVSGVLTRLFGTNTAAYPFYWTGDIKINDVVDSQGKMKEHYIILVSPQRDNDSRFAGLEAAKLAYDQVNRRVIYEGRPLVDWSYVVLRIAKGREVSVDKELYESVAAWAVLGRSQFVVISVSDGNVDQVRASAQSLVAQLKNQLALLLGERKFSKRDRAIALHTFAMRSVAAVKAACTRAKVAESDCPTWELDQFRANAAAAFGLEKDPKMTAEVANASVRLDKSISGILAKSGRVFPFAILPTF